MTKAARRGRPAKSEADKVISNGLYKRQWEKIQKMALLPGGGGDAAKLQRDIVERFLNPDPRVVALARKKGITPIQMSDIITNWYFDAITAEESGPVATPEQDKDYEKLTTGVTTIKKQTKSKKR